MSDGESSRIQQPPLAAFEDHATKLDGPMISVACGAQAVIVKMAENYQPSTVRSVAVDPVALITTECITVTSAMRKHARWAHSSVSAILGGGNGYASNRLETSRPSTPRDGSTHMGQHWNGRSIPFDERSDTGLSNRWGLRGKKGKSMQDSPLMAAFARLRSDLNGCTGTKCCRLNCCFLVSWECLMAGFRYSGLRHAFAVAPFSAGHKVFLNLCAYHIACPCRHHQILCIQNY